MGEMSFLFCGAILGAAGMAFLVLLWNVRTEFTEIKWHNAAWEDPKEYKTIEGIEVLALLSSGRIVITAFFPEVGCYASWNCGGYNTDTITHWAYAVEVGNTILKHIEPTYNDHHDVI